MSMQDEPGVVVEEEVPVVECSEVVAVKVHDSPHYPSPAAPTTAASTSDATFSEEPTTSSQPEVIHPL